MRYAEDELLSLSGLQHLVFCERQWALIHVEQIWVENRLTAEGRVMHKRADTDLVEQRHGVKIVRGMRIFSADLGLVGRGDVVEFRDTDSGAAGIQKVTPVEYKRGRPKKHDADLVQLCAQAMCLEEMLDVRIGRGYLFYGRTRRRTDVALDQSLRDRTAELAGRMHELFRAGVTPLGRNDKGCDQCSLVEVCLPHVSCGFSAAGYVDRMIDSHLESE